MTASIVGWAHTPFGKFDNETVESLIVRAAKRSHGGRRPAGRPISTRSCSATSTPASRRRISRPRWCCRPIRACASSRRRAWRTPAPPALPPCIRAVKSIEAGAAKTVLVVGVEQMTRTPGPEIGKNLLRASYLPEDGDTPAGFAGVFGKIATRLFPALRRPVRRAGDDRGEEPQERRRQPLRADAQGFRLRVLPRRGREESVRRRPA